MKKFILICIVILISLCLGYIGYKVVTDKEKSNPDENGTVQDNSVGLPNPASVNCEEKGGNLIIEEEVNGQVGYCIFEDGSKCEEWAFFRGECKIGENN